MCDQTVVSYNPSDIVWVKLSNIWWPAEVQDQDTLDEDVTSGLRERPFAVVKFFNEQFYECVKTLDQIYHYNCLKKNEFIKKGLDKCRPSFGKYIPESLKKFPADVMTAETRTGGNPDIINDPMFLPQEKIDYSNIFPSSKKNDSKRKQQNPKTDDSKRRKTLPAQLPVTPSQNNSQVDISVAGPSRANMSLDETETRSILDGPLLDTENHLFQSFIRIQTPCKQPTEPLVTYKCPSCDFSASRINIITYHMKIHSSGLPDATPTSRAKSDKSKSKRKSVDLNRTKSPKKKKTPSTPKSANKTPRKRSKKSQEIMDKANEALRENILKDWDDEEDDNELLPENDMMAGPSTSAACTSALPRPNATNENNEGESVIISGDENVISDNDRQLTDEQSSAVADELEGTKTNDSHLKTEDPFNPKSCFDFEDNEDSLNLDKSLKFGQKLPRLISPEKNKKSADPELSPQEDGAKGDSGIPDDHLDKEFQDLLNDTQVPQVPIIPGAYSSTVGVGNNKENRSTFDGKLVGDSKDSSMISTNLDTCALDENETSPLSNLESSQDQNSGKKRTDYSVNASAETLAKSNSELDSRVATERKDDVSRKGETPVISEGALNEEDQVLPGGELKKDFLDETKDIIAKSSKSKKKNKQSPKKDIDRSRRSLRKITFSDEVNAEVPVEASEKRSRKSSRRDSSNNNDLHPVNTDSPKTMRGILKKTSVDAAALTIESPPLPSNISSESPTIQKENDLNRRISSRIRGRSVEASPIDESTPKKRLTKEVQNANVPELPDKTTTPPVELYENLIESENMTPKTEFETSEDLSNKTPRSSRVSTGRRDGKSKRSLALRNLPSPDLEKETVKPIEFSALEEDHEKVPVITDNAEHSINLRASSRKRPSSKLHDTNTSSFIEETSLPTTAKDLSIEKVDAPRRISSRQRDRNCSFLDVGESSSNQKPKNILQEKSPLSSGFTELAPNFQVPTEDDLIASKGLAKKVSPKSRSNKNKLPHEVLQESGTLVVSDDQIDNGTKIDSGATLPNDTNSTDGLTKRRQRSSRRLIPVNNDQPQVDLVVAESLETDLVNTENECITEEILPNTDSTNRSSRRRQRSLNRSLPGDVIVPLEECVTAESSSFKEDLVSSAAECVSEEILPNAESSRPSKLSLRVNKRSTLSNIIEPNGNQVISKSSSADVIVIETDSDETLKIVPPTSHTGSKRRAQCHDNLNKNEHPQEETIVEPQKPESTFTEDSAVADSESVSKEISTNNETNSMRRHSHRRHERDSKRSTSEDIVETIVDRVAAGLSPLKTDLIDVETKSDKPDTILPKASEVASKRKSSRRGINKTVLLPSDTLDYEKTVACPSLMSYQVDVEIKDENSKNSTPSAVVTGSKCGSSMQIDVLDKNVPPTDDSEPGVDQKCIETPLISDPIDIDIKRGEREKIVTPASQTAGKRRASRRHDVPNKSGCPTGDLLPVTEQKADASLLMSDPIDVVVAETPKKLVPLSSEPAPKRRGSKYRDVNIMPLPRDDSPVTKGLLTELSSTVNDDNVETKHKIEKFLPRDSETLSVLRGSKDPDALDEIPLPPDFPESKDDKESSTLVLDLVESKTIKEGEKVLPSPSGSRLNKGGSVHRDDLNTIPLPPEVPKSKLHQEIVGTSALELDMADDGTNKKQEKKLLLSSETRSNRGSSKHRNILDIPLPPDVPELKADQKITESSTSSLDYRNVETEQLKKMSPHASETGSKRRNYKHSIVSSSSHHQETPELNVVQGTGQSLLSHNLSDVDTKSNKLEKMLPRSSETGSKRKDKSAHPRPVPELKVGQDPSKGILPQEVWESKEKTFPLASGPIDVDIESEKVAHSVIKTNLNQRSSTRGVSFKTVLVPERKAESKVLKDTNDPYSFEWDDIAADIDTRSTEKMSGASGMDTYRSSKRREIFTERGSDTSYSLTLDTVYESHKTETSKQVPCSSGADSPCKPSKIRDHFNKSSIPQNSSESIDILKTDFSKTKRTGAQETQHAGKAEMMHRTPERHVSFMSPLPQEFPMSKITEGKDTLEHVREVNYSDKLKSREKSERITSRMVPGSPTRIKPSREDPAKQSNFNKDLKVLTAKDTDTIENSFSDIFTQNNESIPDKTSSIVPKSPLKSSISRFSRISTEPEDKLQIGDQRHTPKSSLKPRIQESKTHFKTLDSRMDKKTEITVKAVEETNVVNSRMDDIPFEAANESPKKDDQEKKKISFKINYKKSPVLQTKCTTNEDELFPPTKRLEVNKKETPGISKDLSISEKKNELLRIGKKKLLLRREEQPAASIKDQKSDESVEFPQHKSEDEPVQIEVPLASNQEKLESDRDEISPFSCMSSNDESLNKLFSDEGAKSMDETAKLTSDDSKQTNANVQVDSNEYGTEVSQQLLPVKIVDNSESAQTSIFNIESPEKVLFLNENSHASPLDSDKTISCTVIETPSESSLEILSETVIEDKVDGSAVSDEAGATLDTTKEVSASDDVGEVPSTSSFEQQNVTIQETAEEREEPIVITSPIPTEPTPEVSSVNSLNMDFDINSMPVVYEDDIIEEITPSGSGSNINVSIHSSTITVPPLEIPSRSVKSQPETSAAKNVSDTDELDVGTTAAKPIKQIRISLHNAGDVMENIAGKKVISIPGISKAKCSPQGILKEPLKKVSVVPTRGRVLATSSTSSPKQRRPLITTAGKPLLVMKPGGAPQKILVSKSLASASSSQSGNTIMIMTPPPPGSKIVTVPNKFAIANSKSEIILAGKPITGTNKLIINSGSKNILKGASLQLAKPPNTVTGPIKQTVKRPINTYAAVQTRVKPVHLIPSTSSFGTEKKLFLVRGSTSVKGQDVGKKSMVAVPGTSHTLIPTQGPSKIALVHATQSSGQYVHSEPPKPVTMLARPRPGPNILQRSPRRPPLSKNQPVTKVINAPPPTVPSPASVSSPSPVTTSVIKPQEILLNNLANVSTQGEVVVLSAVDAQGQPIPALDSSIISVDPTNQNVFIDPNSVQNGVFFLESNQILTKTNLPSPTPAPSQDILAKALANTQVLSNEPTDLNEGLEDQCYVEQQYPVTSLSHNVLETSLTLNQPIMTPVEQPPISQPSLQPVIPQISSIPSNLIPVTASTSSQKGELQPSMPLLTDEIEVSGQTVFLTSDSGVPQQLTFQLLNDNNIVTSSATQGKIVFSPDLMTSSNSKDQIVIGNLETSLVDSDSSQITSMACSDTKINDNKSLTIPESLNRTEVTPMTSQSTS